MFNKDLEEIKNSQLVINNAITETKNILEGNNSRITETEGRINELEDRIVEINRVGKRKRKAFALMLMAKIHVYKIQTRSFPYSCI